MARPASVLWLISCGFGLVAGAGAVSLMFEAWRHPEDGMGIWFVLSMVVPLPAGAVIGVLLARLERAATGLRHPRRFWWVLASMSAMYLAHWVVFIFWMPLLIIDGEGDEAIYVFPSWFLAGLGGVALVVAVRLLRARTWDGVTGERQSVLPRLSTPVIAAVLYGSIAWLPGLLVCVLALEESNVPIALGGWLSAGAVSIALAAGFAVWLYRQVPYAVGRNVSSLRFAELAGAFCAVHWGIPFALSMLPMWDRGPGDRFLFAMTAGIALVIGVGCWSGGRAWRSLPA